MKRIYYIILIPFILLSSCAEKKTKTSQSEEFSGSESCIECHERFYELWSPSHHGKAMQPITKALLLEDSIPSSEDFELEGKMYQVLVEDTSMVLLEKDGEEISRYEIIWALGGKNVFYFLTPIEDGKLQTTPLAYDVRIKKWYNNPESAVRHFPEGTPDEALPWKDRMYTFNTSCYSCHVSQLASNFDLASDSYQTTWKEPGINCETCHGPSAEHVRIFREAKDGEVPDDIGLIVTKHFTQEQHNSSCAPCHAKMQPITASFMPGDLYFDNYGLTTLENSDFYPDGRDLGENYTMTGWHMNECVVKSEMHCVTCHTSSGRYRFNGEKANNACLPCHQENVDNVAFHSQHPEGTEGAVCINCHMPKTEFGRMVRSDHSFRPPMPEATIKFDSPNACNICHQDKSPQWANKIVKARPNGNYQEETLEWAQLIEEAREQDWSNLNKMLEIIGDTTRNEVVVNSLIRLLVNCAEQDKWEPIKGALANRSPLVRSSAASGLTGNFSEEIRLALVKACSDKFRVVRVAAALSLSSFPENQFSAEEQEVVAKATEEYRQSLVTRPDDWSAHYNMGIFHQNRGDAPKALDAYETSARLYPEAIMPLINSSVLYSYIGNHAKAEENLKKAIEFSPEDEAANLNLGLLLAEQGRVEEAIKALETSLKSNPNQGVAAYNLSVLYAGTDINKTLEYAEIAASAVPENYKYAYTLAFYQNEAKQSGKAINTLKTIIKKSPSDLNSVYLLAQIYVQTGKKGKAKELYMNTIKVEGITSSDKARLQQALVALNR